MQTDRTSSLPSPTAAATDAPAAAAEDRLAGGRVSKPGGYEIVEQFQVLFEQAGSLGLNFFADHANGEQTDTMRADIIGHF